MPQTIWRGAISFGLVHIPVRVYPAIAHQRVDFGLLDKRSMDPIGYRKVNKRTGKEVPAHDIVRGVEYERDHYVVLSDAEIAAANPESTQTIDILAFVEAPEISFLYLDTPYFLAPDAGGEKVYALLRDALKKTDRLGVANIVLHRKQHLASLIPVGSCLALNTLHWSEEIRETAALKLPPAGPGKNGLSERELKMATQLIEDMTEPWDPEHYHETFHDDIMKLVQRKVAQGKTGTLHAQQDAQAEGTPRRSADILDLTEVLKRSLAGASRPRAPDGEAAGTPAAPKTPRKTAHKTAKKSARKTAHKTAASSPAAPVAPAPRRSAARAAPAKKRAAHG